MQSSGEHAIDESIRQLRHTGDRAKLLDAYRNYLRVLALSWIEPTAQSKIDASDLVQEAMIKADQRFDQFRGSTENELLGWMRQILSRQLIDASRRIHGATRDISHEVSISQQLDASDAALGQLLSASQSSPSSAAARREASVVLADALAELKAEYREVVVLRNLRELDWQQVAQRMGRTEGSVRMLWTRALKQLRPLLEGRT